MSSARASWRTDESGKAAMRHPMQAGLMGLLLALSGCTQPIVTGDNYLTYKHPFNDAAAEKVRESAEKLCKQRNQAALKIRSVCSLDRCFTDYQCVNPKDPLEYDPPGIGPP